MYFDLRICVVMYKFEPEHLKIVKSKNKCFVKKNGKSFRKTLKLCS